MNENEISFRLVNRTSKAFSIIIANFQYAATFLFNIRDRLRISFVMSILANAVAIIRLRKVKLVISQMKLITKLTETIQIKTTRLIIIFRQKMKSVSIIYLRNPIGFISKAHQKMVSIIYEGKLKLLFSPVFVILYRLGYWDTFTLLPLDSNTLGEMDYTIV